MRYSDLLGKNHKPRHRAEPHNGLVAETVPRKNAVRVGQQQPLGRQVAANGEKSVGLAKVRVGEGNAVVEFENHRAKLRNSGNRAQAKKNYFSAKKLMSDIERHPLKPFLPPSAKVLMLGSFPPPRARWSMDFFYPNFQNDMWRVLGLIFYADKNRFVIADERRFDYEAVVRFCTETGIAIFDTASAVRRLKDNASDKFLEIVEPTDLAALLSQIPDCHTIVTTGEKATDAIVNRYGCPKPKVGSFSALSIGGRGYRFFRMPSTSRAYPLALEKKAEFYAAMFKDLSIGI